MAKGIRIRGLAIELGGDTTQLQQAFKEAKTASDALEKELKQINGLLKLDPGNTELIAQKQKVLAERVSATTKKLEALKTTQEEFNKANNDKNSEQYRAIEREIIGTEQALKEAKKEAEAFNETTAKASGTLNKVANAADTVYQKTQKISAAAGLALVGLTGMAHSAVTLSDDLNTLANQTGLTTEEIQKFKYASDIVDVSIEDISGSLTKMKRSMSSTSADTATAWQTLGISTRDASGQLRDHTEVFYEVLEGLSKIENGTERDVIAMQLFGKSADSLAGIIDDGGAALKAYGDEAANLGVILDQETLDSLNAVNDQLDAIKAQLQGELAVAGAKAMSALQPVFEVIVTAIKGILDWIGSLSEGQIKFFTVLALGLAALAPAAKIISTIATSLSSLQTILVAITPVIGTLFTTVSGVFKAIAAFALANPIALIIAGTALLITGLIVAIIKNWDTVKGFLTSLWEKAKEVFTNIAAKVKATIDFIVNIFKGAINLISSGINLVIEGINFFIRGINHAIELVNALFGSKVGTIKEIGTIPMLANGGVLSSGSAIVGEAGPELLSMQNGSAVVRPLTNSTTNNNIGGTEINYIFKVDNIRTFEKIENKLRNERRTQRMGYVGG